MWVKHIKLILSSSHVYNLVTLCTLVESERTGHERMKTNIVFVILTAFL
jgi:hypothetical protein